MSLSRCLSAGKLVKLSFSFHLQQFGLFISFLRGFPLTVNGSTVTDWSYSRSDESLYCVTTNRADGNIPAAYKTSLYTFISFISPVKSIFLPQKFRLLVGDLIHFILEKNCDVWSFFCRFLVHKLCMYNNEIN